MGLKIGTRGSKLALWQANLVKDLLEAGGHAAELVLYKTTGDIQQSQPLHKIGEKGLFTKALDEAQLRGEVDLVVHSSKDLPSVLPDGLEIGAFLKREDPRDVLLAVEEDVDLDNLSRKLIIGTSSLRRGAFLRHYLPHCEVKLIRGNVDTRVAKMEAGEYDGILLAYAGVKRMGMTGLIRRKLNVGTFTPAVGQGAIAVTVRSGEPALLEIIRPVLNHTETEYAVQAERALLRTLEGGCSTPIFGLATVQAETLSMHGGVARTDGTEILRDQIEGHVSEADQLGQRLANLLKSKGATLILNG